MANANKTEAAKKAWETIRAKKAAAAAGLPVPPSTTRTKAPEVDYSPRIAAWLGTVEVTPEVVAPAPEPPASVETPAAVEATQVAVTPEAPAPVKRKRVNTKKGTTKKKKPARKVTAISKAKKATARKAAAA